MVAGQTRELAAEVVRRLVARGDMLVTAESCTGGLVAAALTDIAGSSEAIYGGFVTYDNRAKRDLLGVTAAMLESHGAVSDVVARAMAEGARRAAGVGLAVAVTGIAGPGGGSARKPVGLVYFACATAAGTTTAIERRFGDIGRRQVREKSVDAALELVRDCLLSDSGVPPR